MFVRRISITDLKPVHLTAGNVIIVCSGGNVIVVNGRVVSRPHEAELIDILQVTNGVARVLYWLPEEQHPQTASAWFEGETFVIHRSDKSNSAFTPKVTCHAI